MKKMIGEFGKQILASKQYENIPVKSKGFKKRLKAIFETSCLDYLIWFIKVYLKETYKDNSGIQTFRVYMQKRFKMFFNDEKEFSYSGDLKSLPLFEEISRDFVKDRLHQEIDYNAQFQILNDNLLILEDEKFKMMKSFNLTENTIRFLLSEKEFKEIKNNKNKNSVIKFMLEADGDRKPVILCNQVNNDFIFLGVYKFKSLEEKYIELIKLDSPVLNSKEEVKKETEIIDDTAPSELVENTEPVNTNIVEEKEEKFVIDSRNYIFKHNVISAISKYVDKYVLKDVPEKNKIRFIYSNNKTCEDFIGKKIDGNFVPGAFVYALLSAYKSIENFYLIIENISYDFEEKLFGDLSFLIARNDSGESSYSVFNYDLISLFNEKNVIFNGNNIQLPPNLYIICTTKDEKLTENIDKEKWQFVSLKNEPKYIKFIENLHIPLVNIKWNNFVNKINELAALISKNVLLISDADEEMLINENKPSNEKIVAEKFYNGIILKLWNLKEEYRKEIFNDFSLDQIKELYLNDEDGSSFEIIFKCYSSVVVVDNGPDLNNETLGDDLEF